ncbi:MAG: biosynthetic-type acetolactate synthase large subunit [Dehalococcoidales bacterium]
MKKTGSQILCESLINEGVDTMFGILGGVIIPFYDTLPQYPQLRHILVAHEQGGAHAAEGYARATGKVGVCVATSGPGATNLVTGIADAYMDSIPMVAITGQVASSLIGKDAFQEIDITGITLPITKHNYLVTDTASLAQVVKEAFYLAQSGRPGPVLIDIPKDVLTNSVEYNPPTKVSMPGYKPKGQGGHPSQINRAIKLINDANKPLIVAGHGVIISKAYDELKQLAETSQIPVVTTLLGISSFPESHSLSYGWIGMHGMTYANLALQECDLMIAIGMRFDDRVTGKITGFAPKAKIIHIDIDPAEIGKNVPVDVPIVGDIKPVLKSLNKGLEEQGHPDWVARIDELRKEYPSLDIKDTSKIIPQYVIRQIYEITKGDAIVTTGVGQHQMWTAQHFWFDKPNSLITSGGLGTMGFGLPAAMGAKVACPDENVWCIDGDGSFQMNIQELGTIARENIGVKIVILNNGFLGMVRQWQEFFYEKRYVATPLCCPDFVKIAEAYNIPGITVRNKSDVIPSIQKAIETEGPFLLNFVVDPEENVYPMVPAGASLSEFLEEPIKKVRCK